MSIQFGHATQPWWQRYIWVICSLAWVVWALIARDLWHRPWLLIEGAVVVSFLVFLGHDSDHAARIDPDHITIRSGRQERTVEARTLTSIRLSESGWGIRTVRPALTFGPFEEVVLEGVRARKGSARHSELERKVEQVREMLGLAQ